MWDVLQIVKPYSATDSEIHIPYSTLQVADRLFVVRSGEQLIVTKVEPERRYKVTRGWKGTNASRIKKGDHIVLIGTLHLEGRFLKPDTWEEV